MRRRIFWLDGKMHVIETMTDKEYVLGMLLLAFIIAYGWFSANFTMPEPSDYHSTSYCDEARKTVFEPLKEQEQKFWKTQERKSSPSGSYGSMYVEVREGMPYSSKYKSSLDYLGNGEYEIVNGYSVNATQSLTVSGRTTNETIANYNVIYKAHVVTTPSRTWYGMVDKKWKVTSFDILYSSKQ